MKKDGDLLNLKDKRSNLTAEIKDISDGYKNIIQEKNEYIEFIIEDLNTRK